MRLLFNQSLELGHVHPVSRLRREGGRVQGEVKGRFEQTDGQTGQTISIISLPPFLISPPSLPTHLSDTALADPLDDELLQDTMDGMGVGDGSLRRKEREEDRSSQCDFDSMSAGLA